MGIVVGLTGGIGSGKSTVSQFLHRQYQIAVVDADLISRQVVLPGQPAFATITERFPSAQQADGQLDRAWLRQHILPDPNLKTWLEGVTHPYIRQHIVLQLAVHCAQPYQILDAALLFETGLNQHCDWIVVVDAPPELQLDRVAMRDATPVAITQQIIAQQCPRAERLQQADWVLDNSRSQAELFAATEQLHQHLIQKTYE